MKPKLGIVVVTHNSGAEVSECIRHLRSETVDESTIWIVDSGSETSSRPPAGIADKCLYAENYGYGTSVNIARRNGLKAAWIAVINPDARVTLRELGKLADAASEAGVAIAGPRIAPGPSGGHFLSLPTAPWRNRVSIDSSSGDFRDVASVQGAVMLIRSDVFDSLNGFDERFFLYFEEVDLCVRARHAGHRVAFNTQLTATHAGGEGSGDVDPTWRLAERTRGKLLFLTKHYGRVDAAAALIRDLARTPGRAPAILRSLGQPPRRGLPFPGRPLSESR